MDKNLERAKELLPAIILTILSMIQAIALELFWGKVVDAGFLWEGGWDSLIGWLQVVAMFVGILLIWLVHVSFVIRFIWLPSLEDMVIPFFIGLLEFAMIDLLHPDFLGPWMLLLAAVFAVSIAASHFTMRRARREPENAYFFNKVGPAQWRDYRHSVAVVATLALFGVILCLFSDSQLLALLAMLAALVSLGYQSLQSKRYWMHSMLSARSGGEQGAPSGD
jgi:predicted lysophospholipase L1 biosynthesis ABC-type transport system permease subunit